jgi:cell division control protein 7
MSSDVAIRYNEIDFHPAPVERSSEDPICGYTLEQTAGSRRLSRRASRLNNPDKGEDEISMSHSIQRAENLETTEEPGMENDEEGEDTDLTVGFDYDRCYDYKEDHGHDMDQEEEELFDSEDEEGSLLRKPSDEQAEIREEIDDLNSLIPGLSQKYRIFDRLGTGEYPIT